MKRLTALAAAIPILAIAGLASAHTNATAAQVKGGEFFFKLSTKSIPTPGTVTFTFKNVGHVVHDFKVDGKKTPLIQRSAPGRFS